MAILQTKQSDMMFNESCMFLFAEYYRNHPGTVKDAFAAFLNEQKKPESEPGICLEVLEAAAEMCGVSMNELSNGRKYGNIPTVKQLTAKILHELKCSDETIASKLPQMGSYGSVRSRREAAARRAKGEKNYRAVLEQLRKKFIEKN